MSSGPGLKEAVSSEMEVLKLPDLLPDSKERETLATVVAACTQKNGRGEGQS